MVLVTVLAASAATFLASAGTVTADSQLTYLFIALPVQEEQAFSAS